MQPHRFQALLYGLLTFFILTLWVAAQWIILTTWPSQSAISPEKAQQLFVGVCGLIVSLVGIVWAWRKGKDGVYRRGVWIRWYLVLLVMLSIVFTIVIWNNP